MIPRYRIVLMFSLNIPKLTYKDIFYFYSTINFHYYLTGNACYKEKLKSSSKGLKIVSNSFV